MEILCNVSFVNKVRYRYDFKRQEILLAMYKFITLMCIAFDIDEIPYYMEIFDYPAYKMTETRY